MNAMTGQFSSLVFLQVVWMVLLATSLLVFVMGLGLALRIPAMMRFFELMNRWVAVRGVVRPLATGGVAAAEPIRRPMLFGAMVTLGAAFSVFVLIDYPLTAFMPLYMGKVPIVTAVTLSATTKWLLVVGNALCLLVGVLMLSSPALLTRLEAVFDTWYTVRGQGLSTSQAYTQVDQWVLAHATVSGIALMVMALGLAASVLARL